MKEGAPNINRFWADLVIEELVRQGVTHFFVAPGSRSAPLVTAVADNPRAEAKVHFDERGTSFLALGAGLRTHTPAVWITTSGTAVANGFPAVVEASQSCVPLILLTSDRPFELRDAGANQAIDQVKLFGNYVRWTFDFPTPDARIPPESVLTTVSQAVGRAIGPPAGPVHLNMPFREPLSPERSDYEVSERGIRRWLDSSQPFTVYGRSRPQASEKILEELESAVVSARRGLIIIGGLPDRRQAERIVALASGWRWPVLADITSQARLGAVSDQVVQHPHFAARYREGTGPDVVLRFGSKNSSKAIDKLLAETQPGVFAVIAEHLFRRDPGHLATHRVCADPPSFCESASGWSASVDSDWAATWRGIRSLGARLDQLSAGEAPVTEPGVARRVTQMIPADHNLFLASSMPVRDFDMFADGSANACWVGANRGASGVDGTVATAVGTGLSAGTRVTMVVGDLALLHDLNSLALLRKRADVLVVVNNDGGGIFSFLPIAKHRDVFERWFGTPHGFNFEPAARMFGLRYTQPESMAEFSRAYKDAIDAETSSIIEIRTDRTENMELHRQLEADVAALL